MGGWCSVTEQKRYMAGTATGRGELGRPGGSALQFRLHRAHPMYQRFHWDENIPLVKRGRKVERVQHMGYVQEYRDVLRMLGGNLDPAARVELEARRGRLEAWFNRRENPMPVSSPYTEVWGFIRPSGHLETGSGNQDHPRVARRMGYKSTKDAVMDGNVRFMVHPEGSFPMAGYELLDRKDARELAARHLVSLPRVDAVWVDLWKVVGGRHKLLRNEIRGRQGALDFLRSERSQNPGVVKRFFGGLFRNANWIITWGEFLAAVKGEMKRRRMIRAGEVLDPDLVDALKDLYDGSIRAYKVGGQDAVDEYLGQAAVRVENPFDWAQILGLGVIAGAVQGLVEPVVTKRVYGRA